jgi:hypothetical protein
MSVLKRVLIAIGLVFVTIFVNIYLFMSSIIKAGNK